MAGTSGVAPVLTGGSRATAERIAEELGIDDVTSPSRPPTSSEIAALSMSGSSFLVAVNALML